jgi:CheY-like chemotaxis protein
VSAGVGVLLVDDEPDVLLLLRLIVERSPYDLFVAGTAPDAVEGLDLFERIRPDVVCLDQMMPGMTGLEMAERLLSVDPEQPIVLCSAFLDDHLESQARAIGVRACLSKQHLRELPRVLHASTAA